VDDAILGQRIVLPDQTAHLLAADSEAEAHFVCALLNCVETRFTYKALLYKHPSTFFFKQIAIPQFDAESPLHTSLAALSQQAHQLAAAGDEAGLAAVEAQVDEAAAELWGITDRELKEIRRSLKELG